ncbi:MAG: hypothetical protein RLZ98_854 [Pseudomonadota bacterium]
MTPSSDVRVAIATAASEFLDVEAGLRKAERLIGEASGSGALLVAFGEAWLPGYPLHAAAARERDTWWRFARTYLDQSIEIPGPATDALCAAAKAGAIDVVIGVSEREPMTQGTIYSTILHIDASGEIAGRHRKLRPQPHERAVWGDGEGSGLKTYAREYGFVSALASVEHQMVAPTYLLAEQGTQIHVACWSGGAARSARVAEAPWPRQRLLSAAFAVQAGAFVLCAGTPLNRNDVPEPYRAFVTADLAHASAVFDPMGEMVGPVVETDELLVVDCDLDMIKAAKIGFDLTGHSARADQLEVKNHAADDDMGGFDHFGGGVGAG